MKIVECRSCRMLRTTKAGSLPYIFISLLLISNRYQIAISGFTLAPPTKRLCGKNNGQVLKLSSSSKGTLPKPCYRSKIFMRSTSWCSNRPALESPPLMMFGGIFDDIGKFFNSHRGEEEECNGSEEEDDGEMSNNDTAVVFTIPARSVKVGALRLLLMLHLMGQQNSPNKGTWKCQQREEEDGEDVIVMQFMVDQSASLSVIITDWGIKVKRRGIAPSMQFMIQESILLQGLIDQLDHVLYSEEVKEGNRLLVLKYPLDGLDKARATIPFT